MMTPRYDNVTPLRQPQGVGDLAFEAQKALVNHEAEQALLGAIMLDNRAYDAVSDFLGWEDFAHPLHGRIYAAAGSLVAGGQPANAITLGSYFADDEILKTNGGMGYLAKLAMSAVTVINAYWYGKTIFDLARRRDLVEVAEQAIIDAASPSPDDAVDAVIEKVEQRLYEIAEQGQQHQSRPLAAIAHAVVSNTESAYKAGGAVTVDTGLLDVDGTIRGMSPGDLIVLAGRPSMGKSALAGTVATNAGKAGKHTIMFSLEMTAEELGQRWIAARTGITTEKLRHGDLTMTDWPLLRDAEIEIAALPITVDDQPRISVAAIRQRARRLKRRSGLDLILIDHLQLIRQGGKQESRRLEIGDATSSLKAIAKELGVPILLLSQINRKVEDRDDKRPTLADLKESGDIEQDADIVLFLYREEYYLAKAEPRKRGRETKEAYAGRLADWQDDCERFKGIAEIGVAKNRHGRTGTVKVHFDAERQRFDNLARWEQPR
jgi:replicative DNA helicase